VWGWDPTQLAGRAGLGAAAGDGTFRAVAALRTHARVDTLAVPMAARG